jgi:hypothetical protein
VGERESGSKKKSMKTYKKTIILILGLILILFTISLLSPAPKTQFTIIYTNDVMGEVEPCG